MNNNEAKKTRSAIIKEGIKDMPNDVYHSIDGISSSSFKDLSLSVAIFNNKDKFKYESEAMIIGTLNHTALLEPHIMSDFIETTSKSYDTEITRKIKQDNPDKIVVPYGSIDIANERAEKVKIVYGGFISLAKKEISIIVYDEDLQLYRKARADLWLQDNGVVIDYKTSKENTPEHFRRASIFQYGYDVQSAWYIDTINMAIEKFKLPYKKINTFGWIISPSSSPYKPFGGIAMNDIVEIGRAKYTELITKYKEVNFNNGQDELFKAWHTDEYIKNNY